MKLDDLKKTMLTPQQQEYYPAIKWIVNDGPRGSGRTFSLALAFVEKAIECGHPIRIWDHDSNNSSRNLHYLLDIISGIVHKLKHYDLKVVNRNYSILITWNNSENQNTIASKFPDNKF